MLWRRWRSMGLLRLRSVLRRSNMESELEEELRFHLQCKAEEETSHHGVDAREARYRALRALGGIEQRKEEMRDMRRVRWFTDFADDVKYTVRAIGHAKLFTLLVVLTLGLGIGANSAIFSLADAFLLRPLPVYRPSEIVTLSTISPNSFADSMGPVSYRDYVDYRDQAKSFSGLAAFSFISPFSFAPNTGQQPKLKGGLFASGNLFRVMGVQPLLGRAFNPDEDRVPGRDAVVFLGYEFWQSEFGGDSSVIGRSMLVNGIAFSIIGVAPKTFTGLDAYVRPDFYLPIMMWPRLSQDLKNNLLGNRAARNLNVKGRLRPGVSIAEARSEVRTIAANIARSDPKTNRNEEALLQTELALRLRTDRADASLAGILALLAAAVLVIACANVASLLLGRAKARAREIAVRLAIGAGRFRLIRLLLAESFVIALLGGMAGIVFGYGGIAFLGRYEIPTDMPMKLSVKLDERVFMFSLAVSLLSALLCGLTPALQAARTNLTSALKNTVSDVRGRRRLWGRNMLVVFQVAASLALLTAALQMVRTFQTKLGQGAGFRTDHILALNFNPQLVRYSSAQTQNFYQTLVRSARTLPGVQSVALCGTLPMDQNMDAVGVAPEGFQMPPGRETFAIDMAAVDENYFATFAVQLIRGRGFLPTDSATSTKVAVVNEEFAKHYWPASDALGKRFRIDNGHGPEVEIVGITKTVKYEWIGEPPTQFVYLPFAQHPRDEMTLLVQSTGPSASVADEVRQLVRTIDSGQPIYNVRTIEQYYQKRVVAAPVMISQLVSTLGLIGFALALAGLYGVMTYATNRRTREIGIRMAIGADSSNVLGMVLRQAVVIVASGIGLGLLLALVAERGLNAFFETSGTDVTAYALVLPAMLAIAMLAASIPARRAARIDPSRALRYE